MFLYLMGLLPNFVLFGSVLSVKAGYSLHLPELIGCINKEMLEVSGFSGGLFVDNKSTLKVGETMLD